MKNFRTLFLITLVYCFSLALPAQVVYYSTGNLKLPTKKKSSVTGQKYSEDDWNKILEIKSYPGYEEDKTLLRNMSADFASRPAAGSTHSKILAKYENPIADLDRIKNKYDECWTLSKDQMANDGGVLYNLYTDARPKADTYFSSLKTSFPDPVGAARSEEKKYTDVLSTYKNGSASKEQISALPSDESVFDFYSAVAGSYFGKQSAEVSDIKKMKENAANSKKEANGLYAQNKKAEDLKNAEIRKTEMEKKEYDKIASREMPDEHYSGSDGAALRSKIIQAWGSDYECGDKYKVMKVYLLGRDWEREAGYEETNGGKNFEKYDYDFLDVAVAVHPSDEPTGEFAYIVYYSIIQDHMNHDKMDYINFKCYNIKSTKVLRSKVR